MNPRSHDNLNEILKQIQDRRKLPRKFATDLQKIQSAGQNTSEKIFYEYGGIAVWAAYSLIKDKIESTGHIPGRKNRRELFNRINQLDVGTCQALARQLNEKMGSEQRAHFERVLDPTSVSNDAERECSAAEGSQDTGDIRQAEGSQDTGNVWQAEGHSARHSNSTDSTTIQPTMPTQPSRILQSMTTSRQPPPTIVNLFKPFTGDQYVLTNASIDKCASIFPLYLAGAVVKQVLPGQPSQVRAAVSMVHMSQGSMEYLLRIEVMSTKIEHIAYMLFNIQVEMKDGHRYIYLPHGQKVYPLPDIFLGECRIANIDRFFGQQIANAIFATPTYQVDAQAGNGSTGCVSMKIPAAADSSAYILILLGPREALELRDSLYT